MDEKTIAELAQVVGLGLTREQLPAVLEQFRRAAQVAQPMLDAPLEPEDEPAPVWRP